MYSKSLRAFIAGSSFPATVIPLIYMGIATTITPEAGFHYFSEVLSICILFGILNIIFCNIKNLLLFTQTWKYWFFGWCHGLFFTIIWNFWLQVPEKLFHLSWFTQYLTIPVAIILYACIWRYIVRHINVMMSLDT